MEHLAVTFKAQHGHRKNVSVRCSEPFRLAHTIHTDHINHICNIYNMALACIWAHYKVEYHSSCAYIGIRAPATLHTANDILMKPCHLKLLPLPIEIELHTLTLHSHSLAQHQLACIL